MNCNLSKAAQINIPVLGAVGDILFKAANKGRRIQLITVNSFVDKRKSKSIEKYEKQRPAYSIHEPPQIDKSVDEKLEKFALNKN